MPARSLRLQSPPIPPRRSSPKSATGQSRHEQSPERQEPRVPIGRSDRPTLEKGMLRRDSAGTRESKYRLRISNCPAMDESSPHSRASAAKGSFQNPGGGGSNVGIGCVCRRSKVSRIAAAICVRFSMLLINLIPRNRRNAETTGTRSDRRQPGGEGVARPCPHPPPAG